MRIIVQEILRKIHAKHVGWTKSTLKFIKLDHFDFRSIRNLSYDAYDT